MKQLITTGITLSLIALSSTAMANDLISRSNYANELERCVAEIDDMLGAAENRRLRHLVTGIDKSRSNYTFVIETLNVTGESATEIATTECAANRFNERTKITARNPVTATGGVSQVR